MEHCLACLSMNLCLQPLCQQMGLDFVTSDVPNSSLFNQGACKDTFFPQLDDPFQHTKATVKDNNKTQVKYWHK